MKRSLISISLLFAALAALTVLALACNRASPTDPDITVWRYTGTFISDSGRDLTGFGWEFEYRDPNCRGFQSGKLPSDRAMRVSMECEPKYAHEVRLFKQIYDPNDPGPYAVFADIDWQPSPSGDAFEYIFHVK